MMVFCGFCVTIAERHIMRILITGGLGFQGRHVAKRMLATGQEVVLLVSPQTLPEQVVASGLATQAEIVVGDILDTQLVEQLIERVDVVLHLAGKINPRESIIEPVSYVTVNVHGTMAVLEAVRKHAKRLLYISSCAVYGDGANLAPGESFSEESPLLPVDPYAASKVAADRLCYAYARSYGLDITIVRPFSTYGPGQVAGLYGGLIPNLTARAKKGESLVVYGDGSAVRDFKYIDDLVTAYELLLMSTVTDGGQVFNIASGTETKVIDVVSYIANRFGVLIDFRPANPTEVKRYAADISKIQRLGFTPKVSLTEGLDTYFSTI